MQLCPDPVTYITHVIKPTIETKDEAGPLNCTTTIQCHSVLRNKQAIVDTVSIETSLKSSLNRLSVNILF